MARAGCPECGHKVSMKARACPACGHPFKSKSDAGCGCLAVLFVIAAVLWVVYQSDRAGTGPEEDVSLRGEVLLSPSTLTLRNRDSFAWKQVRIHLNLSASDTTYEFRTPEIGAGQRVQVPLSDFLDGSRRFNPLAEAVLTVYVSAQTPQGRGHLPRSGR